MDYEAQVKDYPPFGMLMPGRTYSAQKGYRYGFNGKENDNEIKGEGNQQDYGMRIYDPRLGRFLSVDPISKSYPDLTPYQFASNRPIDGIDLDGYEYLSYNRSMYRMGCNTIKTDITSANGTVYHVESDVTIVREVYQNIPSSLKDAKTQSFTHVKGGPVTDKGRDYDSKLDGQSIFDRSKYYYAGPVFYGTAEDGKSTNGITQLKGNTSIQQQTLAQNINGVGGAVGQNGAGGMTSNIVNAISTWPDLTKEVSLREGFYNATNLVDAYLQTNPVTG